jgi:peptidoglycan/LPS O-acetylase OafA/YrhL
LRISNNFDAVRLAAAFFVVFGHAFAIMGEAPPGVWGMSISTLGLKIFFCVSGYLVTDSWERQPNVLAFLTKRALRIFPGLIAVITVSAVILGPCLTPLSLSDYFANGRFINYFRNCFLYIVYDLPGLFPHNAIPVAVNGSLWSLPVEFFCYFTVPIAALLSRKIRIAVLMGLTILCGAMGMMFLLTYKGPQIVFYATDVAAAISVMCFFMFGAVLRLVEIRVPTRVDVALILCLVNYGITGLVPSVIDPVLWFTLPYIVIAFGRATTPGLRMASAFGDLSYGMYLSCFPLQQVISQYLHGRITPEQSLLLVTPAAIVYALMSWHLVERPCLSLKPGRNHERTVAVRATA